MGITSYKMDLFIGSMSDIVVQFKPGIEDYNSGIHWVSIVVRERNLIMWSDLLFYGRLVIHLVLMVPL